MPPRRPARKPASPLGDLPDKVVGFFTNLARGEADEYLAAFSGAMAPWLKAFALNAAPRIKATVARGNLCDATNERNGQRYACDQMAGAQCAACGRNTCMYHAFLTWKGDALCWHCASHTVVQMSMEPRGEQPPGWQRPNVPPPGGHGVPPRGDAQRAKLEAEIERSLSLLGLTRTASWDDVNKAFRSYVQRNHPDKVPEDQRAVAQEQFKQVNAAFNFLKEIGWGQRGAS